MRILFLPFVIKYIRFQISFSSNYETPLQMVYRLSITIQIDFYWSYAM
jgi:hypothetical protein